MQPGSSEMDLVDAIRKSLTGFVCGIFGFLPLVGFIPALFAVACWYTVQKQFRDQWNPAGSYLRAGLVLATIGILSSALLVVILLFESLELT